MYKIIDLGHTFEETGEPRVRFMDSTLVKTASNAIQDYWDKITDTDKYAYVWVIGVSAYEYYGPNNNGDAFNEDVLKKYMHTFLDHAHIFLHHVNKDPKRSLGKPVFVHYNEDMHRVELVLAIDRNNILAQETLKKLKDPNHQLFVSMGANVPYDECSLCGHRATNRASYCNHLKYNMKKILPNGKQIFAFNPEPKFFDISIVNKPADPTAFALDKVASAENYMPMSFYTEKLAEDYQHKIAALDKLSDIIKQVEGTPVEGKDDKGSFPISFKDNPPIDYPAADFDDLEECGASPGGIIRVVLSQGAIPSFGETVYAAGKHHFGESLTKGLVSQILEALPGAISMLRREPEGIESFASPVFNDFNPEDLRDINVIRVLVPKAKQRVVLIKQAGLIAEQDRDKYIGPDDALRDTFLGFGSQHVSQYGPRHSSQYTVQNDKGQEFVADRRAVNQAKGAHGVPEGAKKLLGSVLAAAAIGALFSEPDLTKKMVMSGVLGASSVPLLRSGKGKQDMVETVDGYEIPISTLFHEKKASLKGHLGTIAGMSVPAALGLDYYYTRKVQYPGHPDPRQEMGFLKRTKDKAGEAVKNSPFTALVAGGIGGAAGSHALRRVIRKI